MVHVCGAIQGDVWNVFLHTNKSILPTTHTGRVFVSVFIYHLLNTLRNNLKRVERVVFVVVSISQTECRV